MKQIEIVLNIIEATMPSFNPLGSNVIERLTSPVKSSGNSIPIKEPFAFIMLNPSLHLNSSV